LALTFAISLFLVVSSSSDNVELDSWRVEMLIERSARADGFEIAVDCPETMRGRPGDTWLCGSPGSADDPFAIWYKVVLQDSERNIFWDIAPIDEWPGG
jgi:hypothetical protein